MGWKLQNFYAVGVPYEDHPNNPKNGEQQPTLHDTNLNPKTAWLYFYT
jgi:hypothetical protein